MSEIELVKTEFDGKHVNIKLPLELLKFACENNPELKMVVCNDQEFGEWIAEYLWEFDEDPDTGISAFQKVLDNMFFDMYEFGGPVCDPTELDGCDYDVEKE